jgi:hypothetical protein
MIETLTTYQIADRLLRDSNACWTRSGAFALAEYLQEMEDSTGEQIEFDAVAIRCDFSEYPSAVEAYNDISTGEELTEDDEEKALEWLRDNCQVIDFKGGVIVSNYFTF